MVQAKAPVATSKRGARDVPERIGKYVIINEVGQGSTGRVFLSHDPYYGRDVAIKLYNFENEEDEQKARVTRKMFFNEQQMMGRLQHPNILPIYDAGEENGSYYVVTEHVHGARTLAAYCRPDNLLRVDDVVEIMFKCAKGLHYAHGRGVIHRDVKPSNIMLTLDNDVRVIDFGIALIKDSDVSRIEGIAGSPSYMSPEQVQSAEITPRSDIYSLGAVMYELLTGYRPFRANSLSKLLHQIVYATPPPIHTLRNEIPEELEAVVVTALQKEPDKRYPNGLEFAGALTRLYQTLRNQYDRIDQQEQFDLLRTPEILPRFLALRDLGAAARERMVHVSGHRGDHPRRRARRSVLHHRHRLGQRAVGPAPDWRALRRRLFRGDQLRARRASNGNDQCNGRRDVGARELDAARAGFLLLPTALQQGVSALADRAFARRRAARYVNQSSARRLARTGPVSLARCA